jgi:hypothetical protein
VPITPPITWPAVGEVHSSVEATSIDSTDRPRPTAPPILAPLPACEPRATCTWTAWLRGIVVTGPPARLARKSCAPSPEATGPAALPSRGCHPSPARRTRARDAALIC